MPSGGAPQHGASVRQWPGMRTEYAWLPPHGDETVTQPGQVGISYSAHRDVTYRVDGRRRTASYDGGSVVVAGESPIEWSDVREPTEALEIYLDPVLLGSLSRRRATGSSAWSRRSPLAPNPV